MRVVASFRCLLVAAAVLAMSVVVDAGPARAAATDTLVAGEQLAGGERLTSPNGAYSLDVQPDGNLVLNAPGGRVLWHSWTWSNPGALLVLQPDGNLVLYSQTGRALFHTSTWGSPGTRLVLQDDGNLVVYRSDGTPAWYTGMDRTAIGDTVAAGRQLTGGQSITSQNGQYQLVVQRDGNVVTYGPDRRPLWDSNTWWSPGAKLTLQRDGNLVIYSAGGAAIWHSFTWGNPGSRLVIQDDGNLVLYKGTGVPAWYTWWDGALDQDPANSVVMAVYGDSYSGDGYGGNMPGGWVSTVGRALDINWANWAVGGSGYVLPHRGSTFPGAATAHPVPGADVAVVMGSLNDAAQTPQAVYQAAQQTYATIRATSPSAALIVIGPVWPNANPYPSLLPVRDAVRTAALEAGATFVDPLQEGWFNGRPYLIGSDGWHPNVQGQEYLATKIRPYVAAALGR